MACASFAGREKKMDSNIFPRKRSECRTNGCIYSRSIDQPYPRKCERCGVAESAMTPKTDDVLNAREHLLAEIQAHGVHHNVHAGTLDTLNKFIRTQPPHDGWKDISTAPRDGRNILVPGGMAYWRENRSYPDISCWFTITGCEMPGRPIQYDVRHWMPFPELPTQPAKTEGEKL